MEHDKLNMIEKEQRIQKLFEKAVKRCKSDLKTKKLVMIALLPIVVLTLIFAYEGILWTQVAAFIIMVVLILFYTWQSIKYSSPMSKSGDVNEFLSLYEDWKKKNRRLIQYVVLPFYLVFILVHFKGQFDRSFIYGAIFYTILFCVFFWFVHWSNKRDWDEVREIKELMTK